MTTHDLARILLAGPDQKVSLAWRDIIDGQPINQIDSVGQISHDNNLAHGPCHEGLTTLVWALHSCPAAEGATPP